MTGIDTGFSFTITGQATVYIHGTKINYDIQKAGYVNIPIPSIPPFTSGADSRLVMDLNIRERALSVTGYIDNNSSSDANDTTATKCMNRLSTVFNAGSATAVHTISWHGATYYGMPQKVSITEIPNDTGTATAGPDRYDVQIMFLIGETATQLKNI